MPKIKTDPLHHLKPRNHALIVLISLIVFALAAEAASRQTLTGWEYSLSHAIYSLPSMYTPLFLAITQFGSGWIILILPLVAITRKAHRLALKLFANGVIAYLMVEWSKWLISRPRPAFLNDSFTQREAFVNGYGFPSGHTAIATVVSLTVLPYLPRRYYWVVPVWILAVGFSRIYLGVHAPLDVLGGFSLGLIIVSLQHTISATKQARHRVKHSKNKLQK